MTRSKKSLSDKLLDAGAAFTVVGMTTLVVVAIIVIVYSFEAAIFQWVWNDFLVTHSHLFGRTSFNDAFLPVLLFNIFRGTNYIGNKKGTNYIDNKTKDKNVK